MNRQRNVFELTLSTSVLPEIIILAFAMLEKPIDWDWYNSIVGN
jgi:hypothetical protein